MVSTHGTVSRVLSGIPLLLEVPFFAIFSQRHLNVSQQGATQLLLSQVLGTGSCADIIPYRCMIGRLESGDA